MRTSGSGNYLSSFPYATEMSELLDSRPIAIEEGIDCVSEDSNNTENQPVSEDLVSDERNGMTSYVFNYIYFKVNMISNKYG